MIRASSLDRLLSCPASYEAPTGPRLSGPDDAARTGTALHAIMVPIVLGNPELDAHEIAEQYHVDADEVSMLRACARQLWDRVRDAFPEPSCELEISENLFERHWANGTGDFLDLVGHVDVISCVDNEVRVGDWKSGFVEARCENQLRAYAYLGIMAYRSMGHMVDRASVAQLRVRTREIIPARYTWDQLQRWYAGAVNRLQGEPTYNPSADNCRYCPRRLECPGRQQLLRSEAAVLNGEFDLPTMTPEQLRNGVVAARVLKSLCEDYLDAAKIEVTARGDLPGLAVVQEERREILPEAFDLLEKRLGLNVVKSLAKFSKTAIEKVVKENAPRGRKGVEAAEFIEELEAGGVVNVKTIEKLEVRPIQTLIEEHA